MGTTKHMELWEANIISWSNLDLDKGGSHGTHEHQYLKPITEHESAKQRKRNAVVR